MAYLVTASGQLLQAEKAYKLTPGYRTIYKKTHTKKQKPT